MLGIRQYSSAFRLVTTKIYSLKTAKHLKYKRLYAVGLFFDEDIPAYIKEKRSDVRDILYLRLFGFGTFYPIERIIKMRLNTNGLILKEQNIGEQDKLVTVLTADMGVIRAFVRGAKSIKSQKQSATSLLCYSKLSLYNGKDSYIIDEAQCIEVFFGLRNDIEKLALGQYFAELAYELAPQETDADEYLRVVLNSLYMIANNKRPDEQIKALTELRLLSLSGYTPNLVACDKCGEFETHVMYFNIEHGLLYCENCANEAALLTLSLNTVSAMRHIVFSKIDNLYNFKMSDSELQDLSYVTETYLKVKTERKYKTLDFYKSLRII